MELVGNEIVRCMDYKKNYQRWFCNGFSAKLIVLLRYFPGEVNGEAAVSHLGPKLETCHPPTYNCVWNFLLHFLPALALPLLCSALNRDSV